MALISAVRVRRIGQDLLSFLFRFAHKNLSTHDPASPLSFCASLRNSHEAPTFDSSHLATNGNDPETNRFWVGRFVRVRRIELPTTAWKAVVLPLNYTRK